MTPPPAIESEVLAAHEAMARDHCPAGRETEAEQLIEAAHDELRRDPPTPGNRQFIHTKRPAMMNLHSFVLEMLDLEGNAND